MPYPPFTVTFLVKYIPGWIPFASIQKRSQDWRKIVHDHLWSPYNTVKAKMVDIIPRGDRSVLLYINLIHFFRQTPTMRRETPHS